MKQHWFISLFACLLLTNCQSDYQTLLLDEVQPLQATLLFEKDSNNYIYDIKATDTHLAILNQENDTKLTVYEKGKYDSPVFVVEPATYQEAVLLKPHFRKEVTTDEVILLADNNSRFYRLSPDKSKLVVGTLWGGILETFRIDKRIENISTRYFLPINIQFIKGSIRPTDQTMYGFTSVQALNDRIWGIWIGDKDPNHNSSIVCFDWDGKEIAQYHTDNILLKIAQSPEEPNRVYAVVASPEKGFYLVYLDV